MNVLFEDEDLQEYAETGQSTKNKFKKYARDKKFTRSLITVVTTLKSVVHVSKLAQFSWLKYEQLKHIQLSSVRIMNGRVERLLFSESEEGIEIKIITLDDTHYGNKK